MKKLAFLFVAMAFFYPALANTFIVTSNADSGPGTLRDAINLANANGTTVTDYINFNIADVSITGRTILLLTQLPDLSSNITIDGTTQPGLNIGVTSAKIRISNPTGVGVECIFSINNSNTISIYGIHFTAINIVMYTVGGGNAIEVHNAGNISIGAAGKGNYFTNLNTGVADMPVLGRGMSTNISFKGNIVNLSEDGTALAASSFAVAVSLTNVTNADIGGAQPGEGNYMSTNGGEIMQIATDSIANLNTGYINIINNRLGCDYAETKSINCGTIYLRNTGSYGTDTSSITVKGNHYYNSNAYNFSNEEYDFLNIQNENGFIDIKANSVNILGATPSFSLVPTAIGISGCENGIIGGDNPGDANYIAGCSAYAIAFYNDKNIRITKNSIYCNSVGISASSIFVVVPKTEIFTITDYNVKGTTLANSVVEVFLTKTCLACNNGETYLGNTVADASGNWSFTSPVLLDGAVTATGTSPLGVTGAFSKAEYIITNYDLKLPTCNQNNGYIHGVHFVAGTKYYWTKVYNSITDTIFSQNLDSIGPGAYTFIVEQGKYCSVNFTVYLNDNSPKIDTQYTSIINPSCGQPNGSIHSISLSGSYTKITWKDAANNIVGNTADLNNAAPGQYKLIIVDTINGCSDSTGYFTLANQSGSSLNTNNIQITPAACSSNNGSITGITAVNVTGTAFIQWVDSLNKPIGNNYDLSNVVPGKYRLKFKDASGCDTIITSFYTVTSNGAIIADTSQKIVTGSKCSGTGGSIQQIKVTGGDTYQWINTATNVIAGSSLDLLNVAPGNYQLQISNHYGCSKTLPAMVVPQSNPVPIAVRGILTSNAVCGQPNGFIKVVSFSNDSTLFNFYWKDSTSSQVIGTGTGIGGLGAGTYQIIAKDSNGCQVPIYTASLQLLPPPTINYSKAVVTEDNCNLQQGSITGLTINGLTGPTAYAWVDQFNNTVSNTLVLQNAGAGTYFLNITDANICNIPSTPFTITNSNSGLTPPAYDNLVIPRYTDAQINIKNSAPGNYSLSLSNLGQPVLQQNNTGNFIIPKVSTDTSVYIQRADGDCISDVVKVGIKVVDKSFFVVATAFTPNGDGKNDLLHIKVIGYIQLNYFRIFNRWGNMIFETHNINDGWDGRIRGVLQDAGGFMWTAQGKDFYGNTLNSRGSFILIR